MRLKLAAALGAVGVAAGAFGAHALEGHPRLDTWETASRYHLIHAVVLLFLAERGGWPWRLVAAGTVVFAGTLYALVLTGQTWLGAVTPAGGVLLIAGWASIAAGRR